MGHRSKSWRRLHRSGRCAASGDLVNHEEEFNAIANAAAELVGDANVNRQLAPMPASDDFAFMLDVGRFDSFSFLIQDADLMPAGDSCQSVTG